MRRSTGLARDFDDYYFHLLRYDTFMVRYARKMRELLRLLSSGYTLNLGSGYGDIEMVLGKLCQVISVDIDLSRLKFAGSLAKQIGLPWSPVLADARRIPFKDGSISNCVLSHTLHHIDEKADVVKGLARVSRTRGKVIVYDANAFSPPLRLVRSRILKWRNAHLMGAWYVSDLLRSQGMRVKVLYRFVIPDFLPLQGPLLRFLSMLERIIENVPILNRICGTMIVVGETQTTGTTPWACCHTWGSSIGRCIRWCAQTLCNFASIAIVTDVNI